MPEFQWGEIIMSTEESKQPADHANSDDYEVGYRKPPKSGQFKPGNGLGKGRPKGAKNMKTIVMGALTAKVTAKIDGKVQKATKIETSMHQLANKAIAGDLKAIDMVANHYERYGPQEDPTGPPPEETKTDLDLLKQYLELREWFDDDGEEEDVAA